MLALILKVIAKMAMAVWAATVATAMSPATPRRTGTGAATRASRSLRHLPALMLCSLLLAQPGWAQSSIDERPSAFAMAGDLVVARPIGAVLTAAGAAAFLVSLPFTALAGSVAESAEALVLGPAETTFVRCLGCIEPGYSFKDVERRKLRREQRAEEAAAMADGEQVEGTP